MVLTYDAFQDTIAEQQKKDDRLATMEEQVKALIEFQQKIVNLKTKTPEHELREAKALIKYNKIENDFVKAGLLKEEDKAVPEKKPQCKRGIQSRLEQHRILKEAKALDIELAEKYGSDENIANYNKQ